MNLNKKLLLERANASLNRFTQADPEGERRQIAEKAQSPTVPTTDDFRQDHFLNTPQAEALIDLTVSQSEWLSAVTVKPRDQRAGTMPRMQLNEVVTEGVNENGGNTIATHPDLSEVNYNCGKYQATWFLTLEDISEAAAHGAPDFDAQVRASFAKAMGNDMAKAALMGDTDLDTSTRLNRLLRKRDGWLKQAREQANYATTTYGSAWARRVYGAMLRRMPVQFKDDTNLRWLHPSVLDESFTDYAQTVGAGATGMQDRALLERVRFTPMGIGSIIVPQWPTDQGFDTLDGSAVAPDVATDDGDGTATFRVDTALGGYAAGNAGRTVKVTCIATGVSETLEVLDVASHNIVRSAGSLGQSTISATAADYLIDIADTTGMMLTNPRNLFVVMCRRIRAYRKFEQESERWRVDVFYEADFGIYQPEALVLQDGITPTALTFGS